MTLCMLRDDLFLFVRCLVPKVCAPLSLRRYLLQPLLSSSFIFNFKVHFYNSRWVVLLQKRKKGDRQFKCAHFNNMEAGIFFFSFFWSLLLFHYPCTLIGCFFFLLDSTCNFLHSNHIDCSKLLLWNFIFWGYWYAPGTVCNDVKWMNLLVFPPVLRTITM